MSFYQKHRPQKFSDLLGQEMVTKTLLTQLVAGKTVQAYLFIGHKGTGKTTTARLLAKSLNCESLKDGEPCGKCVSCVAITAGSYLDVLEIDAASNRGIEEIRDLREKIRLAPTLGKMKVYIIDEVHMLTTEAFNALLKTLEEPPKHAVFVLCTTDAHKVPATILSRCQRFEFGRATDSELVELVERTAKDEGLKLGKDAAAAIAGASDGSFRDGLSLLEQLGVGGEVSGEDLQRMTSAGNDQKLAELVEKSDVQGALSLVNEIASNGANVARLNESLLRFWRGELLVSVETKDTARQEKLVNLLRMFSQSQVELKSAVLPTLPLELAVIEACSDLPSKELSNQATAVAVKTASEKAVAELVELKRQEVLAKRSEPKEEEEPEPQGSTEDLQALKDNWNKVLKAVKPLNHSLEAFLRGCEATDVSNKSVTLRFFYKFHKDMVDQAKNRKLVEEELAKLLGREVRLKTVLGEKPQARKIKFEEVQNVEEVASEDLAQKAVDIFNAGIS